MTLATAQAIADNCQMGHGHTYSQDELRTASETLWGASRVDYNRLDALSFWITE